MKTLLLVICDIPTLLYISIADVSHSLHHEKGNLRTHLHCRRIIKNHRWVFSLFLDNPRSTPSIEESLLYITLQDLMKDSKRLRKGWFMVQNDEHCATFCLIEGDNVKIRVISWSVSFCQGARDAHLTEQMEVKHFFVKRVLSTVMCRCHRARFTRIIIWNHHLHTHHKHISYIYLSSVPKTSHTLHPLCTFCK